ncbi:MAG: RNA polymerase sigma factor RpoD/SigA [Bacilli bacterium]|nr:RNA polymerase sigma factor RpoD/SigA [Bacilli bacterium]
MEQIKSIIKKYIKDNIKVSSRPSENLKSLTKITNYFSDLLRSTQDNITYELIDEILLENDVVNTLLTSIMNKYLPYIEGNSLEELFTDEITCQVVEIYCDKNNIDINKLDLSESTSQSVKSYVGESQTMFFNEIRQYRLLTPEETRDLIIKAQNGNMTARDDLINHNIRLIISVAKKFNLQTNQITIGDLIQEGVFGLSKAIEKFDINKGYMFSTYAIWWIKQSIKRFLSTSTSTIRYSENVRGNFRKLDRARKMIQDETGHNPSISELAKVSGLTENQIKDLETIARVDASLDSPVTSEDSESKLSDFIADEAPAIEEEFINEDFKEAIITALFNTKMPERERQIIIHRFGLLGHRKKTLVEVGKMFNVNRERIRQQEVKALRRLQHNRDFIALKNINDGNLEEYDPSFLNRLIRTCRVTKYFPAYSKSELTLAIEHLDRASQNIIKKYYNDEYVFKKENIITEADQHHLTRLIYRVLPRTLRQLRVTSDQVPKNETTGLFQEMSDIPKHLVVNVIFTFLPSEDKTLLKKAYGPKFNEDHLEDLLPTEKEMLKTIIPYVRSEALTMYNSKSKKQYTRQDIPMLELTKLPSFSKLNSIIGTKLMLLLTLKPLNNEDLFKDDDQGFTEEEKTLILANKDLVADFIIEFQELIPKIKQNKPKSIN